MFVEETYIIEFLISFIFVFFAGFLIGFERGSRGEPAGVRTTTLVCFGAMLFTLMSRHAVSTDTTRIAANIVTGVGFIGAGIIMYEGGSVKGLTTAASLWVSAAIGMTIGFGFYVTAVISTFIAFVVLRLPHIGEHRDEDTKKRKKSGTSLEARSSLFRARKIKSR